MEIEGRVEIVLAIKKQGAKGYHQKKLTFEPWQVEGLLYRTIKHTDQDTMQRRDAARHMLVANVAGAVENLMIDVVTANEEKEKS